ncbi:DUF982 domain-containing protein [Bosea sp. (in: a-proteobacteria)]|jgi:hypothetical protein|uniref:DUF982 domain-containing protein n=1 Tax=Bosea sp. (in: a-proteobacteria) TaxID=1871050 RepID=UPI003F729ABD
MARLRFHPPVRVTTANPGVTISISSVERAGEQLLAWSGTGEKRRAAIAACMAALSGKGTPDQVRETFAEAARECGHLIED